MRYKQKFLGIGLILILLLIIHLTSCTTKKETTVYRFIDHFSQENILLSPFQSLARDPQQFREKNPSLYEIADEYPLFDYGIGKNPFLLKKKLKIGLVEINSLLAPPTSRYRFQIEIPEGGFLDFTYGIRRDSEFAQKREGSRIAEFLVVLESRTGETELFNKILNLSPDVSLAFNYKKIDLSKYAGEKVDISFVTRGNEKALAAWFNPVIYSPKQNTKNVILISLDTLRPDHLGCYGYSRNASPSIDSFAKESVLFQNTFATSPWTLPSHVSMLTSLNCINHQVYHTDQSMDPTLITLADILRNEGYFTGAITGGGYVSGLYGFSKGFDSYHVRGGVLDKNAAEIGCRYALDWVERHKDRNFFLFLHTYQIHTPYHSPSPYNTLFLEEDSDLKEIDFGQLRFNHENRYKSVSENLRQNIIDLYDAEIRYTDESLVQPLMDTLKKLDLYDNTMIILTSDHGEEFFEHNSWEHSHSLYNETIKIPLIIKFFGSKYAGKKIKNFARIIDIMPTILHELDINASHQKPDGKSLVGLIEERKEGKSERVVVSELASNVMKRHIPKKMAISRGSHKFILNQDYDSEGLAYFFSPPPELESMEVYDLLTDPDELINKARENPQLARDLLEFLNTYNVQKRKVDPEEAKMIPELREQLKALGYIR